MIEFTEGRLIVQFQDQALREQTCFQVKDQLGSSWPLKDMDFFYSKQQCFYFVEVCEFAQKSRKEIKQYRRQQQHEIVKKALDTLLLAFSYQCKFDIKSNFIDSQPNRVYLYFIYYVDDTLDDDSRNSIDEMYTNVRTIITNYQKITGLPFQIIVGKQQLAEAKLKLSIELDRTKNQQQP